MHSLRNLIVLLCIDFLATVISWLLYYYLRVSSGIFPNSTTPDFFLPMIVIGIFWLLVFWIFGLYRPWHAESRFDEFLLVIKAVTFGVLLLFFLIFIDDSSAHGELSSRMKIILYWGIMVASVGFARLALRSIRRRMLIAGIGNHSTVIIGTTQRATELAETIRGFPALGYRIVGFISTSAGSACESETVPLLGTLDQLEVVLQREIVQDIIITLDSTEHEELLEIIGRCSAFRVRIKIKPDLYDIVSGQARTNQLYGIPLIEVTPQLLAPWEAFLKRALDITVSSLVLIVGSPVFLLISLVQKLTSKGTVLYSQQRVGKDGKVFKMFKFRSMFLDAERGSGPQWATKDDPRVTPFGRILRKSHLDELPQFMNVLEGTMSLVGPRPERPYFVEQFVKEIPLYRRRLNVRPGITGWAQVKHTYDQSIEDVRTKLSYDLFYIENMSIRMDLKILMNTFYKMLAGKGHA